ncbi:DUF3667 domain-containing protein [Epilithonimonas sp.]|uniref:DUF3667 domain-containing protein n=1 Tax=Epilithonimonas sp. TaxID=2894511 RepID=UPI002FDE64F8
MSHGKLREEKDCLNCGHIVEEHYCPHCGQQNIERRQPFHYLFTHFVEDFTHYDGQFWGTLKNLFFKPGKLTNTYLEGKRQKFVPPVKLYIFVSFITFFLFAVFPPYEMSSKHDKSRLEQIQKAQQKAVPILEKELEVIKTKNEHTKKDSLKIEKINKEIKEIVSDKKLTDKLNLDTRLDKSLNFNGYSTRKSFDSAKAKNPSSWDFINVPFAHKLFELKENGVTKREILKKLGEVSFHNLPKALFIYLPVFAFFLWIFHNQRKWWYFDHGIFTLHYFSFLLLTILIFSMLYKLTTVLNNTVNIFIYLLMNVLLFYSMIYFFIAHYKVYRTHGVISFIIGSILFMFNFFAFMFLVAGLGVVSFLMIH